MKTRVFHNLIRRVFAGALLVSLFGAPTPLPLTQAQAAILVKHHYLKIEAGDTLSEALVRQMPCVASQLWGNAGAVAQVSAMNPHIRDINHIHPGNLIDLGEYANAHVCKERAPTAVDDGNSDETQDSKDQVHAAQPDERPVVEKSPDDSESPAQVMSERFGLLEVLPEFSFSRIDSTDRSTGGSAIFSTNLVPGVRLSWGQHWSNSFQTSLHLGIRYESYAAPAGYVLENSSHIMTDFGFGVRWVPFQDLANLAIDSNIDFRQENFARAVSLTSVRLDATTIPELSAGIRYRVLDLSPFTLTLLAQGLILFSQNTSNYDVQSGIGSSFGVVMTEDLSRKTRLTGGLQYSVRSQDTSIATQTRTDVGIAIGITYRLDWALKSVNVKSGDLP